MAGQISAIKKRLQTVNSTRKLTNATELVATVKLQKYNTKTRLNEEYSKNLRRFIMLALKGKGPESSGLRASRMESSRSPARRT